MYPDGGLTLTWFLVGSSFVLLLFLVIGGRKDRVGERLDGLGADDGLAPRGRPAPSGAVAATVVDAPLEQWTTRRMKREARKNDLKERMEHAGLYTTGAVGLFLFVRVLLLVGPAALGFAASRMGLISLMQGLLWGAAAGLAGTLAPSFWLDHVKHKRQTQIRRALPDALDVMVVCLKGGLSLTGALSRVARELTTAHPMLAVELNIVERQIKMGHTTGTAVREFANRFDLEELRSMASVVLQAERIGASVAGALDVFADTLRMRRHQRAEELAHKASIKMLFPTLLFIFPAIFVVILGPAVIQICQQLVAGVMHYGKL